MQFIKNFFKHDSVIGLCGLKRKTESITFVITPKMKKTYISNYSKNYFLS